MRKIFKFPIEPKETIQTIDLPKGAEIVSLRTKFVDLDPAKIMAVPMIKEELYFWAIVDPSEDKKVPRRLMCVGTGWEIIHNIQEHIDTCVTRGGFVWHLLEVK